LPEKCHRLGRTQGGDRKTRKANEIILRNVHGQRCVVIGSAAHADVVDRNLHARFEYHYHHRMAGLTKGAHPCSGIAKDDSWCVTMQAARVTSAIPKADKIVEKNRIN
jgi:hypothetical protein